MSAPGRVRATLAALLAAVAALATWPAAAQEAGDLVVKKGRVRGDQWLAGYTVDVHGVVAGDLTAVGVQAGLDGTVSGDVNLAGLRVRVGGVVGDDARAIGAHVVVQGMVEDGLLLAGGDVEVTRNTFVGGTTMVAGRRVWLRGDLHGDVHAAAGAIELDGDLYGKVVVRSDDVTVGPRAQILGELRVLGRNPARISEGAKIVGKVVHEPPPGRGLVEWVVAAVQAALFQVGMLLVAWAWLVLAPGLGVAAASLRLRRMGLPEAMGAVGVLALPPGALLLAVSVIGIPVAVCLAAAWLLLVLASWSSSAIALGSFLRGRLRPAAPPVRLGERLGWTFAGLLALRVAATLPAAAWGIAFAALLLGAAVVGRAAWDGRLARRGGREEG